MISLLVPIRGEDPAVAEAFAPLSADFEILVAGEDERDPAADAFERIGARLLRLSERSRGARLAAAARACRGEVLVFLHADTRLPERARERIETAVREGAAWGAFRLSYGDPSRCLAWIAWWANLRTRIFELPFGDQGIFCTREAYDRAGGYPELPFCDDLEFSRRLGRIPGFRLLSAACVTSARAYRGRKLRQVLTNWKVMAGYFLGVRPETLEKWYRREARLSPRAAFRSNRKRGRPPRSGG
jgi:glycosyltransferase involved in cell wall biosynthesis